MSTPEETIRAALDVAHKGAPTPDGSPKPGCPACDALAALESLLADRDSWKATAEVLHETDSMAALYESERERADKAEARFAQATQALQEIAEFREHGFDGLRPTRWELADIARAALAAAGEEPV